MEVPDQNGPEPRHGECAHAPATDSGLPGQHGEPRPAPAPHATPACGLVRTHPRTRPPRESPWSTRAKPGSGAGTGQGRPRGVPSTAGEAGARTLEVRLLQQAFVLVRGQVRLDLR